MGKYKFFRDAKKKKEGYKPEDIRAGFMGTDKDEEAMKINEESQKKKKKSYFGDLKSKLFGK